MAVYRAANREVRLAKAREYHREYRKNNPKYAAQHRARSAAHHKTLKRREYILTYRAKKYGLTRAEFDAIMEKPCAICGSPSEHLDHCHETNRVRAGLCARCNRALGVFKDSSELLRSAANYLDEHAAKYDKESHERLN